MHSPNHDPDRPELDETPPLLGTWNRIYLVVIATLFAQILLYAWITWQFAP